MNGKLGILARILGLCGALCAFCAQASAQNWYTNAKVALKKAEDSGLMMFIVADTGVDATIKSGELFKLKEFRDFARDNLVCLKINQKWDPKTKQYLVTSRQNEDFISNFGNIVTVVYDPKTGKRESVYYYGYDRGEGKITAAAALMKIKSFCGVEEVLDGWTEDFESALKAAEESGKIVFLKIHSTASSSYNLGRLYTPEFKRYAEKNLELVMVKVAYRTAKSENFADVHQELVNKFNGAGIWLIDPKRKICFPMESYIEGSEAVKAVENFKKGNPYTTSNGVDWYLYMDAAFEKARAEKKKLYIVFARDIGALDSNIYIGGAWTRFAGQNLVCVLITPPSSIYDNSKEFETYNSLLEEFDFGGGYASACYVLDPETKSSVKLQLDSGSKTPVYIIKKIREAMKGGGE